MIAVVQRVARASVSVNRQKVSEISHGLLILLGVKKGDNETKVYNLARRCANLRIFEDAQGKFNLSVMDVSGAALVVSQFTLLADTSRGRRPSFTGAEEPQRSRALYELFISTMNRNGVHAQGGIFGEHMLVSLDNDGPVTIILEE
jgi:D-tyrosyl-tRNA(Tyr) deacylase